MSKKNFFTSLSIPLKIQLSILAVLFITLASGGYFLNRFIQSQMRDIYLESIHTLAVSLEDGVKGSLERGQMKNFKKLLARQKQIKGVVDVSLYDPNGRLNLSSSETGDIEEALSPEILDTLRQSREPLRITGKGTVHIHMPQPVVQDCIRCHPSWSTTDLGGIISLIYDIGELNSTVNKFRGFLIGGTLALLLLVSLISLYLSKSITRPVLSMTEAMSTLAKGNLDIDIPAKGRGDEIGKMAEALEVFKTNAIEKQEMLKGQAERKAEEVKKQMMDSMTASFESQVGIVISSVYETVKGLQGSSKTMSEIADETITHATSAATTSEETSENVMSVASATEQMNNSIREISLQVNTASDYAQEASAKAETTNVMVNSLSEASQKIGEVVDLINDIAKRTKLLALNATIEAVWAGELGRGFAVVASEVKELAKQTTAATTEIADQISGIQNATEETVKSINDIVLTIKNIKDISIAIASAVEEQSSVTRGIAANVSEAASGTRVMSESISSVARDAEVTGEAAAKVLTNTNELSLQADKLQQEVDQFLHHLRSG